jgi:protein-tyrosine phosphatase
MQRDRYRILMVCMGNICRSPTAEAVLRSHIAAAGLEDAVHIDSAGTHNYHPGAAPDARSQRHAAQRGYDLASLRARQVTQADYRNFDLLLAMDWDNLALLQAGCPPEYQHKLRLLMSFADAAASPVVPDPYYGGAQEFDAVLDLTEAAAQGLVQHVRQRPGKTPARLS